MRPSAVLLLSTSLWSVACQGDAEAPAEHYFEPLCGDERAVELMRLYDDEEVAAVEEIDEGGDLFVRLHRASAPAFGVAPYRSVVVDRCGGSWLELDERHSWMRRWGDVLVGCHDGALVRLSSYVDPAPELLAERGCAVHDMGERWITIERAPGTTIGRLLALDLEGEEIEARELLPNVRGYNALDLPPFVLGDRAFVQTLDLAVRSVDLRTGEVALELERAEEWHVSGDMLAYRDPTLTGGITAPLVIRDRRTGTEETLDVGIPTDWTFFWWSPGVLKAQAWNHPDDSRWFLFDPARELVPPAGTFIDAVRSDGAIWLVEDDEDRDELTVFAWREGEAPSEVFTCTACTVRQAVWRGDVMDVQVEIETDRRYELWRLDDPEGPARKLASGIGPSYRVYDDERVLSVPVGEDLHHGPLQLFEDPDEPGVTLVPLVNRSATSLTTAYAVPGELLYEAGPNGRPHGLLRARLAP